LATGLATGLDPEGNELEILIIFAIAGCILSAAATYLVLDYRRHGEREVDLQKVLVVQKELAKTKKVVAGYTHYVAHLPGAKLAVIEQKRTLASKVVREHTYMETIKRDTLKTHAVFAVKYSTEFFFCFDLAADHFDLVGTSAGIEIRVGKPALYGAPYVRNSSPERLTNEVLGDEGDIVKKINEKLPALAQQQGVAMASEEGIRALCDKKLLEFVSTFLAAQEGVTQVPVISVVYK